MGRDSDGNGGGQREFALLPGRKRESGVFLGLVREVKPPLFGPPRKGPLPPPVLHLNSRSGFGTKFRAFLQGFPFVDPSRNPPGLLVILGLTSFAVVLVLVILLALNG